ncbi:response regulator [Paenibacillus daejeonensis]|uniref:response regulator n=1 Tax=Paenibacillus daejeonensis TaxID=135193 RepID=UPI0003783BA5|nr:response regulator [Paenibacillus daejeonensis]
MMKVLLVEDEALVRRFLRTLIDWEANGYTIVAESATGEEAWGVLQRQSVDLVLTDIRMPVMDGFELIEKINQEKLLCEVVILSSYDDFSYVRQALMLEVSDYVHKATISEGELISCLAKARARWGKRQEQSILQRLAGAGASSRQQLAEYVLRQALTGEAELDYLNELRAQFGLWQEPFDVALATHATGGQSLLSAGDGVLVFELAEEICVAADEGLAPWMARQSASIVATEIRSGIRWEQWPAVYHELREELAQRVRERDGLDGLHESIRKAIHYLQTHYSEEVTLEVISEQVHVSPAYFSRLFMRETGRTFVDYLTGLRLDEARKLLRHSELTVYEVAERVGYRNARYFLKLFKASQGLTPTEYRQAEGQKVGPG